MKWNQIFIRSILPLFLFNCLSCREPHTPKIEETPPKKPSPTKLPEKDQARDNTQAVDTPPISDVYTDRRTRVMLILWASPLGQALDEYLFKEAEAKDLLEILDSLTRRILEQGGKSITLISAIQMMVEDAYNQKKMGFEPARRLQLLQSNLWQEQNDAKSYPGEGLAYLAMITLIGVVPLGSPELRRFFSYQLGRIRSSLTGKLNSHDPISLRELFRIKNVAHYQPTKALKFFFDYFGPFTLVFFYWFDWKESSRGHSIKTQLQNIQSEKEFTDLLSQLDRELRI